MLPKLFGTKKPTADELEKLLAQARRLLWNREIKEAERHFSQVRSALKDRGQHAQSLSIEFDKLAMQAELGVWAVSYLQDQEQRAQYRRIIADNVVDAETWFFIAKVFQRQQDTSPDALEAYRDLLKLSPTAKLAQRIAEFFPQITYSHISLSLLEIVGQILPDDTNLSAQLCRWYVKAREYDKASELSARILRHDPFNVDAHRCIAFLAERAGNWDVAVQHYRKSCDWMRLAVVLTKAERIAEASDAQHLIPENNRNTTTWLYYSGWLDYRHNRIPQALQTWERLRANFPNISNELSKTFDAVQTKVLSQSLQRFEFPDEVLSMQSISPSVQEALNLRLGVVKLLLQDDVAAGQQFLQKAAAAQKNNPLIVTFVLLSTALQRQAQEVDKQIYQQLLKNYGDSSLFMWLRGLTLLRAKSLDASRYFKRALDDGIVERHLPQEAVAATKQLLTQAGTPTEYLMLLKDIPDLEPNPLVIQSDRIAAFNWAVASSFAWNCILAGRSVEWMTAKGKFLLNTPISWQNVQLAYYWQQGDWEKAFAAVDTSNLKLRQQIIQAAVRQSFQQKNWQQAAEFVAKGLDVDLSLQQAADFVAVEPVSNPEAAYLRELKRILQPYILQGLWKQNEFEKLDLELEREFKKAASSSELYHDAAIVYTRLALAKDKIAEEGAFTMEAHRTSAAYSGILEDEPHNDYWQLAIGYWAVVLTDKVYWEEWARQRSSNYGEDVQEKQLQELVKTKIPRLLRSYHEEQASRGSKYASHHRFYASIIGREIEYSDAMSYLFRSAARRKITLPKSVVRYVSPLLIKEYGHESSAREMLQNLDVLNLSPYEAGLIRSAFSPLSDVQALTSVKEFSMALAYLNKLELNAEYVAYRKDIAIEMARVYKLYASHLIELEQWDEAMNLARQGLTKQPVDTEFEHLLVSAAIGWANQQAKNEEYESVSRRLLDLRKGLRQRHSELDNLMSEIWVEWSLEAIRDDDLDAALNRLKNAQNFNASNARAKDMLNAVYQERARSKAQNEAYIAAIDDAQLALQQVENSQTLRLLANLYKDAAIQYAEGSDTTQAFDLWSQARQFADKLLNTEQTQDNLDFFAWVNVGYVVFLYSNRLFASALEIGEILLTVPYSPDAFSINVRELVAGICVDYGAQLYNSGDRWQGRQMTQKALQYDPYNQVARQNLRRM